MLTGQYKMYYNFNVYNVLCDCFLFSLHALLNISPFVVILDDS